MVSAVSIMPWCPRSVWDDASPFTVSFGDVQREPELRRRLSRALASSLFEPPDPRLSWLNQVDVHEARALAHFEPGQGTLEQQARTGARGARRLPLPFLWVLRAINAAAAGKLPLGLREFSAHAVLTIGGGEARLNAAYIDCSDSAARSVQLAPQCLLQTLADCIGARDSGRSLAAQRPILPAPILRTLGELPPRARAITCFEAERDALRGLEQRLQGRFLVAQPSTPCRASDLVRRQLGLLGALVTIDGNAAVERYFESNRARLGAEAEFRSALSAWRGERKLHPCGAPSRGRQDAQREREAATRARVAQARLELRRRGHTVGLAFALDAVCAAPEAPEPWLLLAEIRAAEARGSAALCFSEAICAARGAEETIERVRQQLGLSSEAELARYFRDHGDFIVADWLDPIDVRTVTRAMSH